MGIESAIIGGLISGVGSVAGSAISSSAASDAQADANEVNVALSRENRDFIRQMSDTAHQREIADLRRSGLNPILSAKGAGASTPSTSAAVVQPELGPVGAIGKAMEAAMTNYSAYQGVKQAEAQTSQIRSSEKLNEALSLKAAADTASAVELARNTAVDTSLKKADLPVRELRGAGAKAISPLVHSATDAVDKKLTDVISSVGNSSARAMGRDAYDGGLTRPWNWFEHLTNGGF